MSTPTAPSPRRSGPVTPAKPATRGRRIHVTPSGLEVCLDRDAMTFFNRRAPLAGGRPPGASRRDNPRAASAAAQIRPGASWL